VTLGAVGRRIEADAVVAEGENRLALGTVEQYPHHARLRVGSRVVERLLDDPQQGGFGRRRRTLPA